MEFIAGPETITGKRRISGNASDDQFAGHEAPAGLDVVPRVTERSDLVMQRLPAALAEVAGLARHAALFRTDSGIRRYRRVDGGSGALGALSRAKGPRGLPAGG